MLIAKQHVSQTFGQQILVDNQPGANGIVGTNAALEQEKIHLWDTMQRLAQYIYVASQLDAAMVAKIAEVSATVSSARRWVERLLARYNAQGPQALGDLRRQNGRNPSVLKPDLLDKLKDRLREPPPDGGLWTRSKVAAWMAQRLRLQRVHPQRGWEALRRIGWSPQAPRPRHARAAGPEERAAFKGGSRRRSRRPRRRIPTGRSRSGRRTSTASA